MDERGSLLEEKQGTVPLRQAPVAGSRGRLPPDLVNIRQGVAGTRAAPSRTRRKKKDMANTWDAYLSNSSSRTITGRSQPYELFL